MIEIGAENQVEKMRVVSLDQINNDENYIDTLSTPSFRVQGRDVIPPTRPKIMCALARFLYSDCLIIVLARLSPSQCYGNVIIVPSLASIIFGRMPIW